MSLVYNLNKIQETKLNKKNDSRNKFSKTKIRTESDSDNESATGSVSESETESEKETNNTNFDSKLSKYNSDTISKYIVQDKITEFNSQSIFCYYLWSGIDDLDRWELNRKVNEDQVKKIYKEMKSDYTKKGNFIFYEPVHLGIKSDNIFYVIDGQHRLLACAKLYKKNKYPIQQIPCIIWFPESDEEFIEIFDKINSRTHLDKTKLFNYKIIEIIGWMDKNYGKTETIWGKNRPKINKDLFVEKMRQTDSIHKLESEEIIKKITNHNIRLRGMQRNKRCSKQISDSVHNHAESMDLFLGLDKELEWIKSII